MTKWECVCGGGDDNLKQMKMTFWKLKVRGCHFEFKDSLGIHTESKPKAQ